MTTSPVREAVERLEAWARIIERPAPDGDNSLKVAASVAEQHARDLRTLLSALQEAREALGPFSEAFLTLSSRWQDHEEDWQHALHRPINVGQLRRAAEVYRALSLGGADA